MDLCPLASLIFFPAILFCLFLFHILFYEQVNFVNKFVQTFYFFIILPFFVFWILLLNFMKHLCIVIIIFTGFLKKPHSPFSALNCRRARAYLYSHPCMLQTVKTYTQPAMKLFRFEGGGKRGGGVCASFYSD